MQNLLSILKLVMVAVDDAELPVRVPAIMTLTEIVTQHEEGTYAMNSPSVRMSVLRIFLGVVHEAVSPSVGKIIQGIVHHVVKELLYSYEIHCRSTQVMR